MLWERQMGSYLNLLISHSSSSLPSVAPPHHRCPILSTPAYPLAHSEADAGQVLESPGGSFY